VRLSCSCARTAFSVARIVQSRYEEELACYIRTDCVQRGSHCSESLQSRTTLFSVHGLHSARFALLSVVTKFNYLVPFAWTPLCAVPIIRSQNKVELSCSCARRAFSAARIVRSRKEEELACYIRTDCIQPGSHCSES